MAIPLNMPFTQLDGRQLHLGKGPARVDPRTFKLELILDRATPPPSVNWFGTVTEWGSMLNTILGDCVIAAIAHAKQVVTLNTPMGEITPPDIVVEELYEHACGYVPGDPSSDQGCIIVDTLNYVRQNGMGHKQEPHHHHRPLLYAYADPSITDINHIKQAIAELAVLDIGLQLPITAQAQVGSTWTVVGNPSSDPNSAPGGWGGHSVCVSAYDANTLTCITWGQLQPMTWEFFMTYADEAHALLLDLWVDHFGATSGVNLAVLDQLLQALNN